MRARIMLVFITLFGMAEAMRQSHRLPERVAVHFRADGTPNGWMSPAENLHFELMAHAIILLAFLGICVVMRRVPVSMINVPNRDYWFAPERQEGSRERLETLIAGLGIGISLLFTYITRAIYRANLADPANFPAESPQTPIICFAIFMVAWIVVLFWSFARKPKGG